MTAHFQKIVSLKNLLIDRVYMPRKKSVINVKGTLSAQPEAKIFCPVYHQL